MRIIGGHDYYDSGLAMGQDATVIFLRNGDRRLTDVEMATTIHLPRVACTGRLEGMGRSGSSPIGWLRPTDEFADAVQDRVQHEFGTATVILAGTVHHGVHAVAQPTGGYVRNIDERWLWTAQALRGYATDHGLEVIEGSNGVVQHWDHLQAPGLSRRQIDIETQDLDTWFAPRRLAGRAMEALIAERITIASRNPTDRPMRGLDGTVRPWAIDQDTLGEMQFAKAVDPYTAFQEISMWQGGVLPSEGARPVEITDNAIKIAKAGFHHPTSFRRAKSGT